MAARKPTGLDVIEWAKTMVQYGAGEILLTSMDQDGQQQGYDLALTATVSEVVSIPVIASGGVGSLDHLYDGFARGKADAVLAAVPFSNFLYLHDSGGKSLSSAERSGGSINECRAIEIR